MIVFNIRKIGNWKIIDDSLFASTMEYKLNDSKYYLTVHKMKDTGKYNFYVEDDLNWLRTYSMKLSDKNSLNKALNDFAKAYETAIEDCKSLYDLHNYIRYFYITKYGKNTKAKNDDSI